MGSAFTDRFFAVDVVSFDSDGLLDHLWRTATMEVVAP
jgi:hypothetical protein